MQKKYMCVKCQCILEMILAWIRCTYISSTDKGFKGHFLSKGHSTTTWTKYCTIWTTHPPRVDNYGHFTYYLSFFQVTKCIIHTAQLPTYPLERINVLSWFLWTYFFSDLKQSTNLNYSIKEASAIEVLHILSAPTFF